MTLNETILKIKKDTETFKGDFMHYGCKFINEYSQLIKNSTHFNIHILHKQCANN